MSVSREAAATALGVSLSTICRWEKSGWVVPIKIGPKKTEIDLASSPAFIAKGAGGASPPHPSHVPPATTERHAAAALPRSAPQEESN
jgi:hypothetical protein